jgi:hypothetical protein
MGRGEVQGSESRPVTAHGKQQVHSIQYLVERNGRDARRKAMELAARRLRHGFRSGSPSG